MPFKSDRATLINELEQLLRLMIADDADNTSEFEEIMDIYVAVTGSRYLNERSYVPKSRALVDIVMQFSDREFKVIARYDKSSFIRLVEISLEAFTAISSIYCHSKLRSKVCLLAFTRGEIKNQ